MDFTNILNTMKKHVVALVALGIVLILAITFFTTLNSVQKEGVRLEQQLVAQYRDNQNELSSFILSFNETLGIAQQGNDALNEVLLDAVRGRYEGATSAQPGGGALFSAITEAYPDLTANAQLFQRVQDLIVSGREAYKSKQTKLLDMIRNYETWKNSGIIHSMVVSMVGYPSDENLQVEANGVMLTGEAALAQMKRLVLSGEAIEAYDTGEMGPLVVPTSPAPAN